MAALPARVSTAGIHTWETNMTVLLLSLGLAAGGCALTLLFATLAVSGALDERELS